MYLNILELLSSDKQELTDSSSPRTEFGGSEGSAIAFHAAADDHCSHVAQLTLQTGVTPAGEAQPCLKP